MWVSSRKGETFPDTHTAQVVMSVVAAVIVFRVQDTGNPSLNARR